MTHYDVVIVGGGMAGASLACALAKTQFNVAVIEAQPINSNAQPSFDDRSVALSYGSHLLLKSMDMWSPLEDCVQPIKEIRISERKRLGLTRMLAKEQGVDALGYVVENRDFGRALNTLLQDEHLANLDWITPARLQGVESIGAQQSECLEVRYTHNEETHYLRTQLLVAADGALSTTRTALGLTHQVDDYGLSGIVCNVQTQLPHAGCAYERFTATGPLAFLPLKPFEGRSRSAVVITVKHEEVDDLMALEHDAFLEDLQQRFGQRLGRIEHVGTRSAYPVSLLTADTFVTDRAVLVGNAAQSLNPVAGQGFNLALRDVAVLLECLSKQGETDAGNPDLIQQYAELRKKDKTDTIRFTDLLVKLFSNDIAMLSHLRAGGLMATDALQPLRERFVRRGMGLTGPFRIKA